MNEKRILIYLIIFSICVLLFVSFKEIQYGGHKPQYRNVHQPAHNRTAQRQEKRVYKIVYWTNWFGKRAWYGINSDPEPFKRCPYNACTETYDRRQVKDADAVLFHLRDLIQQPHLPPTRDPNQFWILETVESPANEGKVNRKFDSIFNLTMTYKRTSDIILEYAKLINREGMEEQTWDQTFQQNSTSSKTKMVAWFVSNCRTQGRREKYVSELKKYINVDVYGRCGKLKCPIAVASTCHRFLTEQYKFYLSFENSICTDYITEKLSRPLKTNVVPIVLGGANYTDVLPPNSYIDIKNFTHPRKLAEYLQKLDKDDDLYNSYFEWKKKYKVQQRTGIRCELCEYLHKHHGEHHVVPSVTKFWNRETDCVSPKEYYKGTGFNI